MAARKPKKSSVNGGPGVIAQEYEMVPVDALTPHNRNVNQGDLGAVIESIRANRFYGAVMAQKGTGVIIAGKHRWLGAKECGLAAVPTIWADVTDEEAIRLMLADNRICRLGLDDDSALAQLLQEIQAESGTLSGTGYDLDALDELLADLGIANRPDEEGSEAAPSKEIECPNCGHTFTP